MIAKNSPSRKCLETPVFGYLIIVVSVNCIFLYLLKLYVSFPTVTFN